MDEITVNVNKDDVPAHIISLTAHSKKIAAAITERSASQKRIPHYQPADGIIAWQLLNAVLQQCDVPNSGVFCEWGSGIGHVTLMASSLGLKATGIEIENELVGLSRDLSRQFNIGAEFKATSMYPQDNPEPPMDYQKVDLFFAYPWPSETERTISLFQQVARKGAIYLCYNGGLQYRILRQCKS